MNSKILILDEPTSSLDKPEVEQLFSTVRKLRDGGLSVIFISHFLDQVYDLCDRVTVLRNGKLIGNYVLSELPRLELVSKMVGKDFASLDIRNKSKKDKSGSPVFLKAENLGRSKKIDPFDLVIHKGETIGLAGLLGSGRTEVADLFFGVIEADSGNLEINGKNITLRKPKDAITRYIAFCPEDRKKDGIIADLSVRENIILAMQAKQGIFHKIPRVKQEEIAEQYIKMLNIVTPNNDMPAGNLSGGNQQKVILARWMVTQPELLILDEPTRGIDVAAKAEIMNLAMRLCDDGMSLVFISSEIEEVVRCSDRIAVLRDRHKITELTGTEMTEQNILSAIAKET
jgi:simple sugar transport system ATP-binding protein